MSISILLQDWTTVQLGASDSITQNEGDWADLAQFCDVGIYISTKQVTAGVSSTLHLETSPSRDNDLFAAMTGASVAIASTEQRVILVKYQLSTTTAPLARFVRWRFSATAAAVACFRIWLAANSQGGMFMGPTGPVRPRDASRLRSPYE